MAVNSRRTLELKLGKLGLTLFVGGMSLLLLSMFLLGVLVGQHLDAYPEKYSGGLVDLVRDRFSGLAVAPHQDPPPLSNEQAANRDVSAADEEFDLTFYQVLGNKNSAHKKEEGSSSGAGALKNKAAADGASSGEAAPKAVPKNVLPLQTEDQAALPVQEEVAAPPSGTGKPVQTAPLKDDKTPNTGAFHVQAAAYRDVKQAQKMAQKIKALGFSARVAPKDIPNKGRWFRVVVGGFENRKDAEQAVSRIAGNIKGVKCFIRRQQVGKTQ